MSNNLKKLRKNMKKTQTEVSEDLGVSTRSYQEYESGRTQLNCENLIKLSDYFGCSIDYLLNHEAKDILHLDSFSLEQQKIIELMQDMTAAQVSQLLAYANFLLNSTLQSQN